MQTNFVQVDVFVQAVEDGFAYLQIQSTGISSSPVDDVHDSLEQVTIRDGLHVHQHQVYPQPYEALLVI